MGDQRSSTGGKVEPHERSPSDSGTVMLGERIDQGIAQTAGAWNLGDTAFTGGRVDLEGAKGDSPITGNVAFVTGTTLQGVDHAWLYLFDEMGQTYRCPVGPPELIPGR